jgi:AcrR family transcriptional regulator
MATLDHTPSLAQELAAERFKLATELAITGKSPYPNGAAFVAADQPEFGSREEFAQVLVLREVDEFLATVEDAIRARADDPAAALEAAFEAFLTAAAESPLVRAIVSGDGAEELLPLVTTHGGPVLDRATARLATFLVDGWPNVGRGDSELLAECVVRLAITVVALPAGRTRMNGAAVATVLGPYIDSVFAQAEVVEEAHGAARSVSPPDRTRKGLDASGHPRPLRSEGEPVVRDHRRDA